tara:strand:- start:767 stop:1114 length:348 start_codon:yes stop_codon:yes gene_type:complete
LNITFETYILWLIVLILAGVISMLKSKINWTELARIAPNNPATGEKYRGQSLKRVAEGLRQNVLLYNWLQGNGIRCAKTKKGRFRSGRSLKKRDVEKQKISKELADCNKAIEGSL